MSTSAPEDGPADVGFLYSFVWVVVADIEDLQSIGTDHELQMHGRWGKRFDRLFLLLRIGKWRIKSAWIFRRSVM